MNELLDLDTSTQVGMDVCTTAQGPELNAEKGTQVLLFPDCKNARVQTSHRTRTKTVGKCMHLLKLILCYVHVCTHS